MTRIERNSISGWSQLPDDIAEGINPEAIAATINESLRQQFVQSTIPATAEALAVAALQPEVIRPRPRKERTREHGLGR